MRKTFKVNALVDCAITMPGDDIEHVKEMVQNYIESVVNCTNIEFKEVEELIDREKHKYSVTFFKEETYEVEAADPIEAENKATDMYNADKYAFDSDSPVREISVYKIS